MDRPMLLQALREILPPLATFINLLLGNDGEFWWIAFKLLLRKEKDLWTKAHVAVQQKYCKINFGRCSDRDTVETLMDQVSSSGISMMDDGAKVFFRLTAKVREKDPSFTELVIGTLSSLFHEKIDELIGISRSFDESLLARYGLEPCHPTDVLKIVIRYGIGDIFDGTAVIMGVQPVAQDDGTPARLLILTLPTFGSTWMIKAITLEEILKRPRDDDGSQRKWIFRRKKETKIA